jgi:hypothetical protein
MNPPTIGHELLVNTLIETSRKVHADHILYLSHTHKAPTDPLDWKFKRRVCEAAFPGVNISKDPDIRTPFQALEKFVDIYENAILVVGGDQVMEFRKRMTPYAKEWGINFKVISAGKRIDESNDVSGMSASKLRKFASEGKREEFYNGLPSYLNKNVKKLVYENTIKGLKK